VTIALGINLSFCVKRWVTPDLWASIVREKLGLEMVQLSFDLVDPTWPDELLHELAEDLKTETARHGTTIHSAFAGLAHYTYNQLLHPNLKVRDAAVVWLQRAYRFARLAGTSRVGGPLGAAAWRIDGVEADSISETDYQDLLARLLRLGASASDEGMTKLYIEPTPLRREWPWTIAQALRLSQDLVGSAVPWKYCLDWGHGTFEPLYGRYRARMDDWLASLQSSIGLVHLKQTDFELDRHWDFTESGSVDPLSAAELQRASGSGDRPTFLEVFYPFERDDASILRASQRSVSVLKPAFASGALA